MQSRRRARGPEGQRARGPEGQPGSEAAIPKQVSQAAGLGSEAVRARARARVKARVRVRDRVRGSSWPRERGG